MATVKKVGNKYEVRYDYYDNDGTRRHGKRHFDRKYEADALVKALARDEAALRRAPAFNTWIDEWFKTYKVTAQLEATTVGSYLAVIERLKAHFGGLKLDKITPSKIEQLYVRMQQPEKDTGAGVKPLAEKRLSTSTCQRHHALLRRALKMAARDKLIPSNPAELVQNPGSSAQEITPPTDEEVVQILDVASTHPQYVTIALAVHTGARQSELFGLKWDCVDFKNNKITIRRVRQKIQNKHADQIILDEHTRKLDIPGLSGFWIERDRTKSKRNRTITLDPEVMKLLRQEQRRQKANRLRFGASYIVTDYVCVHEDGMPMRPWNLGRLMCDHRFHDLRHANATMMICAGVPIPQVSKRLGHTTPATTSKVYAHAIESMDSVASEAIASTLSAARKNASKKEKHPHDA
ncbi:MAG: tyrosine-type recombinase/integrase [Christensenellaceae bacterium]|nr:tyrosine-type recombinase/integrase [Christensenellaceae bacterium]